MKARVEAYERHGSERVLLAKHPTTTNSTSEPTIIQQQQQLAHIRRNSDSNQDLSYNYNNYNNYSQQQQQQYHDNKYNNNIRRSYDNNSDNIYSDPEARIAFIKQQKEIEKIRENAQKEVEVVNYILILIFR